MIITLDNAPDAYKVLALEYDYGSKIFWHVKEDVITLLSWNEVIVIEKGFHTDLSSVPRYLWSICPPFGDFLFGAVVHDWLYVNNRHRTTTKLEADKEMLLWSEVLNPSGHRDNRVRYRVVRLHPKAQRWWDHNQKWKQKTENP